jgi:hypothetical protein
MTKEQIEETIERVALQDLADEAIALTRKDICLDCLDRRCESGKACKEFLRRSKCYAWEIAARNAELN